MHCVEVNVRSPYGEIDLVMRDGEALVFCEVKTRRHQNVGHPAEAITATKLNHMVAAAEHYMHHRTEAWRLDVVEVTPHSIHHIANITG